MKNTEGNFISDAHFDVLLRHALLNKEKMFNPQTQETMANQTFSLVNVKEISGTKSNALIEKLTADFKSGGSKFRLNVFLLSLFAVLTVISVIFFTSKKQNTGAIADSLQVVKKDNHHPETVPTIVLDELNGNPLPRTNPMIIALLDSVIKGDSFPIQQMNNGDPYTVPTTMHIPEDKVLHYEDIPTLTEDQKKHTQADKLKMLKDIVNPKKKIYGYAPMGTTKLNGVNHSVQAFYIKNSEVSNWEYRTFINDLLAEGKFDDYMAAVPVKGGWKAAGIPEFEDVYFESQKYNDFPVVNITRKGAESYCNWLTRSVRDAIDKKEIKPSKDFQIINDFRLPSNGEWIYAARAGRDSLNIKYPWQYVCNDVQNTHHCFLCNFNYTSSKDHLSSSLVCPGFERLKQGGFHREIITTAGLAIDTLLTAPVYSYNPNDWGQYCMMGNVSEMVWTYNFDGENKKGLPRALGGNWNSDVNNVMIEAPEQYVGVTEASPYIGFRPVMTYTGK